MAETRTLILNLIEVAPRFLRSVHLERDFYAADAASGYLVTRSTISALAQLSRCVDDPAYRAQCISGPYGSGKSALALYFASLLDSSAGPSLRSDARAKLGETAQNLVPKDSCGMVSVLATGTRENLNACLVHSLKRSLEMSGRKTLLRDLHKKHASVFESDVPCAKDVVAVYETLAEIAVTKEAADGVVVVVDELGKLLEHAALHPEGSDIQVLQELAEAACRSHDYPLWFVTVLHQQFSQYASRLGRRHQRDWDRVQQRFYDVPCYLDGLDAFQLIASAVNATSNEEIRSCKQLQQTVKLCRSMAPRGASTEFQRICLSSYPLHPASLVVLPTLFRKFGQNERSLFSFLSADEPFSLLDWASNHRFDPGYPDYIRLHDIYNYATHTLLGGAPNPQNARPWLEAEEALARLGDSGNDEVNVLKGIALLGAIGETARVKASHDVLVQAFCGPNFSEQRLDEVLESLKDKRLIVYRRYRNAYRLWEGSDIDIGERLSAARQVLSTRSMSLTVAHDLCPTPPMMARRHSYRTGMLRSLDVIPCSLEGLPDALRPKTNCDGRVYQCLVENEEQLSTALQLLTVCTDPSVIILIGKETDELLEAAQDVAALQWVKQNTPALADDKVARQEMNERRLEAELAFHNEWDRLFGCGNTGAKCLWKGELVELPTRKSFAALLSKACDETFVHTPELQNELVNRRNLSSAAAAARGSLIKAMFAAEGQPTLGLSGYPPERSIYESLLLESGIHRQDEDGHWKFGAPKVEHPGLLKAWDFILERSQSNELTPVPVHIMLNELCSAPYGVADGFAPILLCACLVTHDDTIALYEDGVFVPDPDAPAFERLMRRPEKFTLVHYEVDGERAKLIERFSKGLGTANSLLHVTRSLFERMNNLPNYTKITRNLSENALAVRQVFDRAKSPERLMFIDLPESLGCSQFDANDSEQCSDDKLEQFFIRLNTALQELIECYPSLLNKIQRSICWIFSVDEGDIEWRTRVSLRATSVSDLIPDPDVQKVVRRAMDDKLERDEYLESLAFSISEQPPSRWNSADEERFLLSVPALATRISSAETIRFTQSAINEDEDGCLISVSSKDGEEVRQLVRFAKGDRETVNSIVDQMIGTNGKSVKKEILLAAAAELIRRVADSNDSK